MYDLSKTKILSFEIGDNCNLRNEHPECPINHRKYRKKEKGISTKKIIESISYAKEMNFNGYIAFHYYNEPLLYKEKMLSIIENNRNDKYLLWTNGELLNKDVKDNQFLKMFDLVCITCYHDEFRTFFEELKWEYGNIKIINAHLDDRLNIYNNNFINELGCKRPIYELPIDYFGNVHLCCNDWNNSIEIGNINDTTLKEIVLSDVYQKIMMNTKKRLMDIESYPEVCLNCNNVLIFMPKLDSQT